MRKFLILLLFICSLSYGQEVYHHERVPVGDKVAGVSFSLDKLRYVSSETRRCEVTITFVNYEYSVPQEDVPYLLDYFKYLRDEAIPNDLDGWVMFHSSEEGKAMSARLSGGKWTILFSTKTARPFFSATLSAKSPEDDADRIVGILEEIIEEMKSFTTSGK